MGLSASSMNPVQGITYRSTVPQAYSIENKSDFSDAFVQSVESLPSADAVEGAAPVQYPTASVVSRHIGQLEDSKRVAAGLNSIAASFEGLTTGYGRSGVGSRGYGMVGSTVDLFA